MQKNVLVVKDLKKYYYSRKGMVRAIDGVDLEVYSGEIFGFLGPNGAGKTTTLRIVTTLLTQDSGEAEVAGFDVKKEADEVRRHIGYVSQAGGSDPPATGRENLILQGQLYGMSTKDSRNRAEELIKLLDLTEFADRIVYTYSGGQRRRLDVALGLMNRPTILFLDEPTTGLDPQNRTNLWMQIRRLREEGTTILLTTHYMEEADALCDRVAIIDHGRIVALGTPDELKKRVAGDCIIIGIEDAEEKTSDLVATLRDADFIKEVQMDTSHIRLYVDDGALTISSVLKILEEEGVILKTITLSTPSLDDVFLHETGYSLRDLDAKGEYK